MTETFKKLAQGYVPTSAAALYSPSGVTGIIRRIEFKNLDSVAHVVHVYRDGTDAAHEIPGPGSIPLGGTADDDGLTVVTSGGSYAASTDAPGVVTVVIDGLEVS